MIGCLRYRDPIVSLRRSQDIKPPESARNIPVGILRENPWLKVGSEPVLCRMCWSPEDRTGVVESASDLVFAGYDLGGMGQDSGTDQWLGAWERSADAFDGYREAFQAVLEDWQRP
jgi:hypothetical protein